MWNNPGEMYEELSRSELAKHLKTTDEEHTSEHPDFTGSPHVHADPRRCFCGRCITLRAVKYMKSLEEK